MVVSPMGIPLTFSQMALSLSHTPAISHHVTTPEELLFIANNFVLGHAIYDADRLADDLPFFARQRLSTHISTLLSMVYYTQTSSHEHTRFLLPIAVFVLHFYKSWKHAIAPIKPFFVAACWSVLCYYTPMWILSKAPQDDHNVVVAATFFLLIATFSHIADVGDIQDDAADGIRTPAVIMGRDEARAYAVALGMATVYCNSLISTSSHSLLLDTAVLCGVAGFYWETQLAAAAVFVVCVASFACMHRMELVEQLILSSDATHKAALVLTTEGVNAARDLPPPLGRLASDAIFATVHTGDAFGSALLRMYESMVRYSIGGEP